MIIDVEHLSMLPYMTCPPVASEPAMLPGRAFAPPLISVPFMLALNFCPGDGQRR